MAVPTTFSELNVTPASNAGLVDNTTAVEQIDNHVQAIYAFMASVYANSGNGWAAPYLPAASPSYTGPLTGGTGIVNIGAGQFYKDVSGNVGIGTPTPSTKLDVVGLDGSGVQFRTSTRTIGVGSVAGEASFYWGSSTVLVFFSGAERARIDASGNFGIGTTTPGAKLHVNGSVRLDVPVTTTNAGPGGADALPAAPAGYATVNIGGVDRKIPYYP